MKISARRVLIVGATSEIAQGVAQLYAKSGSLLFLVGRDEKRLLDIAAQLKSFGAEHCAVYVADLRFRDGHETLVKTALAELGSIDVSLIAHGIYPDMQEAELDVNLMIDVMLTNAISAMSVMHLLANTLASAGGGVIAVLSSVAGDRGRRNNYIYGASKAALSQYASGLRASMAGKDVHVLTIKPGPVDTHMTTHKNVPLKATVGRVSKDIVNAIETRKYVLYTPWYWRYIMGVIRMLPEWIFMRLKI